MFFRFVLLLKKEYNIQMLPMLFKKTSKGQTQTWQIFTESNFYWVEEGILNGKITKTKPYYCEPKNEGKKNFTTGEEQAEKEALAEWTKKLKRGYVDSINKIEDTLFEKPMKGDKWEERAEEVVYPILVSDKLNGVRVRIKNQQDNLIAISTGGERFYTIPHIINKLKKLYELYPNLVLDGEAFNYSLRQNLNQLIELVSVQRKEKHLTPEILENSEQIVEFHIFDAYGYDGITKETPYRQRFESLCKLLKPYLCKYVQIVPVDEVLNYNTLKKLFQNNKKQKGEGLIVRWGDCPYKHGRSKYLLKWKHFHDAEWQLIDLQEGNGDWAGCAKRAILKLAKPSINGETTFASNILGDARYLRQLLLDKNKVIGKMATVSYQELSEYGIPQLPWVIAIRDYE